jgi:phage terminase small subunit
MNARQFRFVQEYRIDRNGAAAAGRAVYSPQTARQIAHEFLTKPDIAAAVRHGEAEIAAKAQATRDDVIVGLPAAIEQAWVSADPAAQIRGWAEIGRLCGYYAQERQRVECRRRRAAATQPIRGNDGRPVAGGRGGGRGVPVALRVLTGFVSCKCAVAVIVAVAFNDHAVVARQCESRPPARSPCSAWDFGTFRVPAHRPTHRPDWYVVTRRDLRA